LRGKTWGPTGDSPEKKENREPLLHRQLTYLPRGALASRIPMRDNDLGGDKLRPNGFRNNSSLGAAPEEEFNGRSSRLTIVERPVVDVHTDELVGLPALEASRESHGVIQRVGSMA
jgi:hypothetical protein